MNHSNDGGPAFAAAAFERNSSGRLAHQSGMSLRDYFASKAMHALLSQSLGTSANININDLAKYAYKTADAMLHVRQEKA